MKMTGLGISYVAVHDADRRRPVSGVNLVLIHRHRVIAAAMAMALPAQTLFALPTPRAADAAPAAATTIVVSIAPIAAGLAADAPAMLVPLTALALNDQRQVIAGQLEALGREPAAAQHMAGELTADDLAVLMANPKMMQQAGEIDVIIWALIVVGVIVAIVIAAEGSVSVNA